jgi:hypothetical protein
MASGVAIVADGAEAAAKRPAINNIGNFTLCAIGDTYSRMGKPEEAEKYYKKIQTALPGTEYAKRAAQWMETKQPLPVSQTGCVGCHTGQ